MQRKRVPDEHLVELVGKEGDRRGTVISQVYAVAVAVGFFPALVDLDHIYLAAFVVAFRSHAREYLGPELRADLGEPDDVILARLLGARRRRPLGLDADDLGRRARSLPRADYQKAAVRVGQRHRVVDQTGQGLERLVEEDVSIRYLAVERLRYFFGEHAGPPRSWLTSCGPSLSWPFRCWPRCCPGLSGGPGRSTSGPRPPC
jgi:hypothetical protein